MALLELLYLCCLLHQLCSVGGVTEQYQVGADINDIEREASSLLLRTEHTQSGDIRVFPGMRFTCDGSLGSLLFIAENDRDTVLNITFWVWEPVDLTSTVFTGYLQDSKTVDSAHIELAPSSLSRGDIALYRATFQEPLQFVAGDVLGIHQAPGSGGALQYIYNWGADNYVLDFLSHTPTGISTFFSGPAITHDYPLLAVEGESDETCVDGFLTLDFLELFLTKNFNSKVTVPFLGSVNIIPLSRFSGGGTITEWAVKGIVSERDVPELEIWRLVSAGGTGGEQYVKVNDSTTDSEDMHSGADCQQYIIEQQIAFQEDDILAVRSDVKVVLHDAVIVGSGEEDSNRSCSEENKPSDIISISLYIEQDGSEQDLTDSQSIIQGIVTGAAYNHSNVTFVLDTALVIPSYTIPHSGQLTRWLFAAEQSLAMSSASPQLQVWRKTSNQQLDTFIQVTSTSSDQLYTRGSSPGVYEFIVDPPVAVMAGDVLGVSFPAEGEAGLRVGVVADVGSRVYELSLVQEDPVIAGVRHSTSLGRALPLISAEIVPGGSTPTPTVRISPKTDGDSDDEDPFLEPGHIIAVVVVGAAVILAGAVVIGLVLLVRCKHSKVVHARKKMSSIYLSMGHVRSDTKRRKTSAVVQVQTQRSAPYTDYDSVSSKSPNAAVAFINTPATEAHGEAIHFD